MKTASQDNPQANGTPFPGRLAFYHPNREGTGTALRVELRLNRTRGDRYDCFFLDMAQQQSREGQPPAAHPSFDWAHRATVKLDVADICEWLLVLEGRKDRVGGPRAQGLFHQAGDATTLIDFQRNRERGGYSFGLSRKTKAGEQVFRGRILLSDAEAIGIRCIFQTGLFFLVCHRSLFPCGPSQVSGQRSA